MQSALVVDRRCRRGGLLSLVTLACLIGAMAFPGEAYCRRHVLRHLIDDDVSPAAADRARTVLQATVALARQSSCAPGCEIEARLDLLHAQSLGSTAAPALLASLDTTLRLVDSPDPTRRVVPGDRATRALAMNLVARGLARRGEDLPRARQLAQQALEQGSASDPFDQSGISYLATVADIHLRSGHPDSAAACYRRVVDEKRYPDRLGRQRMLVRLGNALESAGREREALAAFVEAAGCYLKADTTAGSRAFTLARRLGLDSDSLRVDIAARMDSSRCPMVLQEHVASSRVPVYHLRDLTGAWRDQVELEGRYTLVEIRDLGCPYCRATAGRLDSIAAALRDSTLGMTCVVEVPVVGSFEGKRTFAENALRTRRIKQPVVIDEDGNLAAKMGIDDTPALLILNQERRVRYQIAGGCQPLGRTVGEIITHVRNSDGRVNRGCD